MKFSPLARSLAHLLAHPFLAIALVLSLHSGVGAHAGHGDEFDASGGVLPVAVNTDVDRQLGIRVETIQADSAGKIMIPANAVVEGEAMEGEQKQWVFIQFEGFYEPVEITTGQQVGDRIEATKNLSVGETLVTEGSLMLYAQSRKTAAEHHDHHHHHDHDHHHHPHVSRKRLAAGGIVLLAIAGIGAVAVARHSGNEQN